LAGICIRPDGRRGLFLTWFLQWIGPRFHPGWLFTSVFFTSLTFLLIAAWTRWDRGIRGKIPDLAAYGMACLMPILSLFCLLNAYVSLPARIACAVAVGAQLPLLYQLFFVPTMRRHFLHYQLAYVLLTFAALLAATYS